MGHALFVLQVNRAARRQVLLRAMALGMEHGTDSLDALLLLVRTSDPAELGDIAQQLASLEGVRSVDCSVAMAPPGR